MGFSEHDSTGSAGGPPGVAVDDVVGDGDVVADISADSRVTEVMDLVSGDLDAGGVVKLDTLSRVVGEGLSEAALGAGPIAEATGG